MIPYSMIMGMMGKFDYCSVYDGNDRFHYLKLITTVTSTVRDFCILKSNNNSDDMDQPQQQHNR